MSSPRWRLLLCTAMLITGCVTQPPIVVVIPKSEDSKSRMLGERIKSARAAFMDGDLALALNEWEVARTLDPKNRALSAKVTETRKLIASRTDALYAQAGEHIAAGDDDAGRTALLEMLALDPSRADALETLRGIEQRRIVAYQEQKLARMRGTASVARTKTPTRKPQKHVEPDAEQEPEEEAYLKLGQQLLADGKPGEASVEADKALRAMPDDRRARKLYSTAHTQAADEAQAQGDLETALAHYEALKRQAPKAEPKLDGKIQGLKKDLAEHYYREGLRVYREDIDRAIAYWEQSTGYDPDHRKAKLRLINAYKVKETLSRIENKPDE